MMKLGKTGKDIFAATTTLREATSLSPAREGGTAKFTEPYTKATVVLRNSQIAYLDRLALDIRAKTGAAVARAELIRAMVDAVAESGLDLTTATSESELKRLFMGRLSP